MVGSDGKGAVVGLQGFGVVAHGRKRIPQRAITFRVLGTQPGGLPGAVYRLLQAAQVTQGDGTVGQGLGVGGIHRVGAGEAGLGLLVVPRHVVAGTQAMHNASVVREMPGQIFEDLPGRHRLTVLEKIQGLVHLDGGGGVIHGGLHGQMLGWQAGLAAGVHTDQQVFQVGDEARGIEQRGGQPVGLETVPQGCQPGGLGGQFQCQGLVTVQGGGDQFRQADGLEQAAGHPADEGFAQHGDDR